MEINRSDEMMKYVEKYYQESKYYLAQNNAKGEEFNIIHGILEDLPNQFNPQTATWGLRLWEEMLGIDGGLEDVTERRAQVMLKLLTMQRTTPVSLKRLVKNVANTDVDIIRNVAPYTFQVVVQPDGFHCDGTLLKEIIENFKEAHMAYYLKFLYYEYNNINPCFLNKISFKSIYYPRFNVPILTYSKQIQYNGKYKYNGLLTDKTIRFYSERLNIESRKEINFSINECLKLYDSFQKQIFIENKMNLKSNFHSLFQIDDKLLFYSNANHKADVLETWYLKSDFKNSFLMDSRLNLKSLYKPKIQVNSKLNIATSKAIVPTYETMLTTVHHPQRYDGKYKYNGTRKYNTRVETEKL